MVGLTLGLQHIVIWVVDPEIMCLKLNKEDINPSKIYSPVGNLVERAKLKMRGWCVLRIRQNVFNVSIVLSFGVWR